MKLRSYLILIIAFITTINAQIFKEIYEHPDFDSLTKEHKRVAILPFTVTLTDKAVPEGMTEEDLLFQKENEGYSFQSSVFSRFLKKSKKYRISFQDIDKTNLLLKKNEITHDKLDDYSKDELAKILGVDAVISGQIQRDKPMKGGAAVALAVFTGFGAATNKAKMYLTIHNGGDGELLWKYNHRSAGGLGSDAESIVVPLMKQVARKFPYKK